MGFGIDFAGLTWGIIGVTLVTSVLSIAAVAGVFWLVFWRVTRPAEDPAVAELKRRLAAGEISPVEYEVRLRALTKGD